MENKVKDLSCAGVKMIKRFEKPVPSAQGMAILGDLAFQLFHTGRLAIFDLKSESEEPLAFFPLGSFNDGNPIAEYTNHSNQCMFSSMHYKDNPIPLLYVTTGSGTGSDEDGYYYRCAVEDIRLEYDENNKICGGKAETLQTIMFKNVDVPSEYEEPCWGCPEWFIDNDEKVMYIFSARYRTTRAFIEYYDKNAFRITKFPLPQIEDGEMVQLTGKDILDQFISPYDILFTQGGMINNGLLYYSFGNGANGYPNGLRIYDLKKKCLKARMDLTETVFGGEEIESISYWNGVLCCNTNSKPKGGFYSLGIREKDI